MALLGGVLFIGLGLLSIFGKDFLWEWTQLSNQMKGVASERTDWWDTTTTISGIVGVLIGIFCFVAAFATR